MMWFVVHFFTIILFLSAGFWTFMWFVCFCYLTNKWSNQKVSQRIIDIAGVNGVQTAIAFSFFSIPTFVSIDHITTFNTQSSLHIKRVVEHYTHTCMHVKISVLGRRRAHQTGRRPALGFNSQRRALINGCHAHVPSSGCSLWLCSGGRRHVA